MANLATVLKEEIGRRARKEIKRETTILRKASAQYRRDIAQLKRELRAASKRVALLESLQRQQTQQRAQGAKPEGKRFSSRSVRTHRHRLGVSAADYGKLIGVTGKTIYTWEQGNARPRGGAFSRWVAIRSLGKRAALTMLAQKK